MKPLLLRNAPATERPPPVPRLPHIRGENGGNAGAGEGNRTLVISLEAGNRPLKHNEGGGRQPLAIDLFCGLGGWTDGLLAEGWDVIGFDIEQHVYGDHRYPAQLVIQDVLTLHGSQFRDADLIVASPPCQEFSYMAMPWSRAKAIHAALEGRGEFPEGYTGSRTPAELTALFNACFRIQREASEAAGRHIPMVVENVRGAQRWVGRARWAFGSFYLWGDVPVLMPPTFKARKQEMIAAYGTKANKSTGGSWFNVAHNTTSSEGNNPDGRKQPGIGGTRANGKGDAWFQDGAARHGSKSPARKAASAMIAKIPEALSRHIAATYKPQPEPFSGRSGR